MSQIKVVTYVSGVTKYTQGYRSSFGRAVNVPVFHAGDPGSKQDVASISFLRVYWRNATIYTTNKAANEVCIDRLYKCAPECDAQSTATSKIIVKHECEI